MCKDYRESFQLGARGANNEFQHGRDFYENGRKIPADVTKNHFLPDLLVEKAEQLIRNADLTRPFYLQFATPLTRLFDDYGKGVQYSMSRYLQRAPLKFLNDRWHKRKLQLAALVTLDDHVRRIYEALLHKGPAVLSNTIILFMNDNGGSDMTAPNKNHVNQASNGPLRMGKLSLFGGGVRVPCSFGPTY
ncbi:hypothetical protein RvY_14988-2 [Ramazzottius varieornatus]|uniref:Uncharacterized protein n=1 Tax=Ramazzottius varieornatus TaxID=947166 RepID=A0A1D1VUP2_RAMVA|nr:hypothetical protein RvY_14988-2 [Ramazzottius varieornatus]